MGRKARSAKKTTRKNPRAMKGGSDSLMSIFIVCFNESNIMEFVIEYYKRQFPGSKITICDNLSTDGSIDIAKRLGCDIHSWDTNGEYDEVKLLELKNTVWKTATTPWVIICDMDELLTANRDDIIKEHANGTTILKTKGYEIYGNSSKNNLSNIKPSLDKLTEGEYSLGLSKKICFNREKITDINFQPGAHTANPVGEIHYSTKEYYLYHYKKLGLEYYRYTQKRTYPRSARSRARGWGIHYTNNNSKIRSNINRANKNMEVVPALETFYSKTSNTIK